MINKIKTPPAVEPVTLAEMRLQIGVIQATDTSRDSIFLQRIISARQWSEIFTRRAFITQTWTQYNDCFDDSFDLIADLQSVTSVKYVDTLGVLQTLAPSTYYVDVVNSRLHLATGKAWPEIYDQPNAVAIEYVSGYGLASAVPEPIKDAIKFIVGQWENYQSQMEGARISTIPYAAEQLLRPYIDTRLYF